MMRKRCKPRRYAVSSIPSRFICDPIGETQTVVSLDLYLAYLRTAFHTCYYCAVVTDHLEELQRKCLKHVRKPLSKMLLEEIKAAEAEKVEKEKQVKDDDEVVEKDEKKEKESPVRERANENRDWKRN